MKPTKLFRTLIYNELSEITKLAVVNKYPTLQPNGDPFANIRVSSTPSDYETRSENTRMYAFYVELFVSQKDRQASQAEEAMDDLVDDVLDKFDQNSLFEDQQTYIDTNLDSRYTMLNIRATNGERFIIEEESLVGCLIRIQIPVSVDVSN